MKTFSKGLRYFMVFWGFFAGGNCGLFFSTLLKSWITFDGETSSFISQLGPVLALLSPLAGAILGFTGAQWIEHAIKESKFFDDDMK